MSDNIGETVSLQLIGTMLSEIRAEQRTQSQQVDAIRTIVLDQVEFARRLDRHLTEDRDDLESMIRAELTGRLGHFETQLMAKIETAVERLEEEHRGGPTLS